jgi:steroid 5-alpha reductase family enzyme
MMQLLQQMLPMLLISLAALVAMMAILWAIHLPLRNAAIVDFGWALGLPICAVIYGVMAPGYGPRKWLIATMVCIWGLRLAFYLLFTRVIGQPEEGRYQQIRKNWATNIPLKFFFFFQFQALLDVVLSIAFLLAAMNRQSELHALEYAAAGLWLVAFLGEAAADAQLKAFKADPANKGKTCRAGLWNYSRHPNYFFEWLIWMAYATFATASPHGWVAFFFPAMMLYFLFKVTGIPATEEQALRTKGDDYRQYQQTTSAFVPWFPKKQA